MPVALNDFVKNLEDSGIVSPSKLQNFLPPKAAPKDAQELAKQLVRSKALTRYQAQEIYLGRAGALILGSYTILEKIGAGGMGQVFKAQHRRMDRMVAIKILPAAMTKDAAAVARFEREVRAAAKLSHPNIVVAFDSDESSGVYFLVMELVEGADLSALVKKSGPVGSQKAVDYILQAAHGLAYAHEQGVVHRDIKPANLLVDAKGTVKILDMGLARLENTVGADAGTAAELTASGTIMGTVDYMAPEQALNTKHADAKSDIYSLGCTLHYLLVGKAPYSGETLMEKLLAHREQPIPDLAAAGLVPAQLQAILEQMIAKEPADRYASMGEVAAALTDCRAQLSEPSAAPPAATTNSGPASALTFLRDISLAPRKAPARGGQTKAGAGKNSGKSAMDQPISTRRRLRIAALAALVLVLGIGSFAGWRAWSVPATDRLADSQPEVQKAAAPPLDSLDPANIPASQRFDWQPKELVAVLGERWGAHGPGYYSGLPSQDVIFTPDGSRLVSCTHALNGLVEWDVKTLRPVRSFAGPQGTMSQLTITPDGKTLGVNGNCFWNLAGDPPTMLGSRYGWYGRSDFDSSGRRQALAAGNQIKLLELTKDGPLDVGVWSTPNGKNLYDVKYFPDGRRIAVLDETGQLYLVDTTATPLALLWQCAVHDGRGRGAIAVSSDGKWLASSGDEKTTRVWDVQVAGLKLRDELPQDENPLALAFVMHDARLLGCTFRQIRVWNMEGARAKKITDVVAFDNPINMSVAKEGTTLATIGNWQIVRLWDLSKPDAPEMFPPVGHRAWVNCLAFSPDGRRLASGGSDHTIRLWDLSGAAPQEEANLESVPEEVRRLRFSPDGKSLVSAYPNRTLVWDLTEPQAEATPVEGVYGGATSFWFDPESQLASVLAITGQYSMKLWSAADGRFAERTFPDAPADIVAATISPDGNLVASASDKVRITDVSGAQVQQRALLDHGKALLWFSADSQSLATLGNEQFKIWDLTQPQAPAWATLKAPPWVWTAIAGTANCEVVFAADQLGRIAAWNIKSGKQITRPGKNRLKDPVVWQMPGIVRELILSPDGRYLASANFDGSVYILRIDSMLAEATGE